MEIYHFGESNFFIYYYYYYFLCPEHFQTEQDIIYFLFRKIAFQKWSVCCNSVCEMALLHTQVELNTPGKCLQCVYSVCTYFNLILFVVNTV